MIPFVLFLKKKIEKILKIPKNYDKWGLFESESYEVWKELNKVS